MTFWKMFCTPVSCVWPCKPLSSPITRVYSLTTCAGRRGFASAFGLADASASGFGSADASGESAGPAPGSAAPPTAAR